LSWYRWDGADLLLDLRVQPRAGSDAFGDPVGERLKLRLSAPPIDGKANAQLTRFLAKAFDVPKARVQLESGAASRNKRVRIQAPKQLPLGLERP
jgi:uncharacterized protein (TIGR00251 family)